MTQRPDGRFFYDRKNEKEEIFMAKNQAQAAEQASKEKTAAQLPVDYDVRIFGAKSSGTQRATASVNINGAFAIRGVKVLESSKGLFVAMPQYGCVSRRF